MDTKSIGGYEERGPMMHHERVRVIERTGGRIGIFERVGSGEVDELYGGKTTVLVSVFRPS